MECGLLLVVDDIHDEDVKDEVQCQVNDSDGARKEAMVSMKHILKEARA